MFELTIRRWELLRAFTGLVHAVCKSLRGSAANCDVLLLHGCLFISGAQVDGGSALRASVDAERAFDGYRCDVERRMQVSFLRLADALRKVSDGDALHLSCVAVDTGADKLTIRVDHINGSYHAETCPVRIYADCTASGPAPADPETSVVIRGNSMAVMDFIGSCAPRGSQMLTIEVADGHSEAAPAMVVFRATGDASDPGSTMEAGYPNGSHFHIEKAHENRRLKAHFPLSSAKGVFQAARCVSQSTNNIVLTLEPAGFMRVSTPATYGSLEQYVPPSQTDDLFESLVEQVVAAEAPAKKRAKKPAGGVIVVD